MEYLLMLSSAQSHMIMNFEELQFTKIHVYQNSKLKYAKTNKESQS